MTLLSPLLHQPQLPSPPGVLGPPRLFPFRRFAVYFQVVRFFRFSTSLRYALYFLVS